MDKDYILYFTIDQWQDVKNFLSLFRKPKDPKWQRASPNKTVPCYDENTLLDLGGFVDLNRSYIEYLNLPLILNQSFKVQIEHHADIRITVGNKVCRNLKHIRKVGQASNLLIGFVALNNRCFI